MMIVSYDMHTEDFVCFMELFRLSGKVQLAITKCLQKDVIGGSTD